MLNINTIKTNYDLVKIVSGENFARCNNKTDNYKMLKYGFCTNHTGKMSGMISYSTSPEINPICAARAKVLDSICHYCFARALANCKKNLAKKLITNTQFITAVMLTPSDIPVINYNKWPLCRLEAFGDLMTTIQIYNYFLICRMNSRVQFALWTKNPEFIAKAMKEYGIAKPGNLVIVYSSSKLNTPENDVLKKYDFIDKVFTVYNPEGIAADHVKINCGARDCKKCGRCYSKRTGATVSEKLK